MKRTATFCNVHALNHVTATTNDTRINTVFMLPCLRPQAPQSAQAHSKMSNFKISIDATGNRHLQMDSDEKVVSATECLEWDIQGNTASLPEPSAKTFFLPALNIRLNEQVPSILDFKIKAEKYEEVIKQQDELGIYDDKYDDGQELVEAIVRNTNHSDQACITNEDLCTETTAPNRTRRQREQPTTEEDTGSDESEVHFLSITPTMSLVADGDRPMRHICHLSGMLGSTVTQRRSEPGSNLRVMSALLKHYIVGFLKLTTTCSDEILAATLKHFLAATEPDGMLCSGRTDAASLRSQAIDGIRQHTYAQHSYAQRALGSNTLVQA